MVIRQSFVMKNSAENFFVVVKVFKMRFFFNINVCIIENQKSQGAETKIQVIHNHN